MKLFLVYAFAFSCALTFAAQELETHLLPAGRLFSPAIADPRELRMAITVESDSRVNAMIGNHVSLLGLSKEDLRFVFGIEGGGYFTMRQEPPRFPLETADGLIGIYGEVQNGDWQGQLRITHISAHMADGSEEAPIPYSREMVSLRAAWSGIRGLHMYGGMQYLVHTIPTVPPWMLQLGTTWFLKDSGLTPFFAVDTRWKVNTRNPSLSLQLGLAMVSAADPFRSFRVFYGYNSGNDPRGQFYEQWREMHCVGIEAPAWF